MDKFSVLVAAVPLVWALESPLATSALSVVILILTLSWRFGFYRDWELDCRWSNSYLFSLKWKYFTKKNIEYVELMKLKFVTHTYVANFNL